jgi:hypothetical protein
MAQDMETQGTDAKRKRTRSPAYPYVNLEGALARAKSFYDKEQRNAANVSIAVKHWGFGEDSSSGAQTLAALISFGLMSDDGTGDRRTVRLTQDALRILLDTRPDSKEKADLIKKAALAPKIHKQLWEKWGAALPSDASLRHALLFGWETPFNENSVDFFIGEYKSTIDFAKVVEADKMSSTEVDKGGSGGEKVSYTPKVGDFVQWEHNGVLGLPEPKRIREITADGSFAFVDGQHGGLLVSELVKESEPTEAQVTSTSNVLQRAQFPPKTHMQEFIVPLSEGAKAIFQWPASLNQEDIDDLKDSLKILERKILRSPKPTEEAAK